MPAITTRGAASAKAFGWSSGGGPVTYIEDVFSTYLYTGNGSTQTITNNIDLSTKGGLVWFKVRNQGGAGWDHVLMDTVRGVRNGLNSNLTLANTLYNADTVTSFNNNGFSLGADASSYLFNAPGNTYTYASWTFRKQPKFFDVVTYTGTGSNTTIAHALGSVPGCIIIKRTDTTAAWAVYHRSLANTQYLVLNTTAAEATGATWWNSTTPTSSVFSVGTNASVNASGGTYVAYIYAHNAGGFGPTGADNVISCGSWSEGADVAVNLGYEPQFVLCKNATDAAFNGSWQIADTMRGLTVNTSGNTKALYANTSDSETTSTGYIRITSTGFITNNNATGGDNMIYIAIRRGPMKVPTVGTSAYNAILRTGTSAIAVVTGVGFAPDLIFAKATTGGNAPAYIDKLRGVNNVIFSSSANAENTVKTDQVTAFGMDGVTMGIDAWFSSFNSITPYINYFLKRAPGFFDEVCYTGTGSNTTQTHNLGVAPELWIVKGRSGATAWTVGSTALANTEYLVLNTTAAKATDATAWNSTFPSSSVFSLGSQATVNTSAATYVAYLFATLAGISKVGSYTGNGSNQTIACGFAAGSRFVMIKRTDSTGDWYVWDSVRGIVAGNDPHISLNTTAAEVTTDDSVDTDNSGFIVNQDAATDINVTSATYIFLAIA